ncbi:MAG: MFS transporter [Pseudomonadota bacterium]
MRPTTLQRSTLGAFSSGGGAYGVFYNAHYFVLIFYSQILGLDPGLAGLAVAIGLVLDAITDPLIGYLSDNTHSRWGRRHPWMFASVLPLAMFFYLLWHPPTFIDGDAELFIWLAVCNVGMRTAMTMFLVPAYALVAELTEDYDGRTHLLTGFHVVYSVVGNGMSVLMYAIWLVPTDDIADGVMNASGYQHAGTFGTVVMIAAIVIFSVGLMRHIPRLRQYQTKRSLGLRQFYRQTIDVFKSRSARMTTLGGIMYAAGNGTYVALWVYIYSFFWEFTTEEIAIIAMPMAFAAVILPFVMPRLIAGRDKKHVAIFAMSTAALVNLLPIALRLIGFFPENGTTALLWIMVVAGFFETILFLTYDIAWQSMVSDLTERTQLETGRRNEGVISSTMAFVGKCADGLGVYIAGLLLALIAFPTETDVSDVADDVVFDLGLIYGPFVFVIYLGAVAALFRYRISRERHGEALRQLSNK